MTENSIIPTLQIPYNSVGKNSIMNKKNGAYSHVQCSPFPRICNVYSNSLVALCIQTKLLG